MFPTNDRCRRCNQTGPPWEMHEDPTTGDYYCASCWQQREASPAMPTGSDSRLEFYRWLYRTGKLTEWPSESPAFDEVLGLRAE